MKQKTSNMIFLLEIWKVEMHVEKGNFVDMNFLREREDY
jgi:hypothetical protein